MPSPLALYPLVVGWLQAMDVAPRASALVALGQLVTALLAGQSLRPSALARALPCFVCTKVLGIANSAVR